MQDDKYTWTAVYSDGTTLKQIEPDGSKNSYGSINREKLKAFEIWNEGKRVLNIPFGQGERLIWRRRVEHSSDQVEICHIVGKQWTTEGKNHQLLTIIFESDGRVETADRWDDQHRWFHPIQIHPEEGEV